MLLCRVSLHSWVDNFVVSHFFVSVFMFLLSLYAVSMLLCVVDVYHVVFCFMSVHFLFLVSCVLCYCCGVLMFMPCLYRFLS